MKTLLSGKMAVVLALAVMAALFVGAPFAMAQEEGAAEGSRSVGDGLRAIGVALGAGLAIAGGALGTARAQAAVGAGGTGALAEKPELFTNVLILFVVPELILIFSFVIAILLTFQV